VQQEVMGVLPEPPPPELRRSLAALAQDRGADPVVRARAAWIEASPESGRAMIEAAAGAADAWTRAPLALAASRLGDAGSRPLLEADLASGEIPLDLSFLEWLSDRPDPGLARALSIAQERAESDLVLLLARARLRLGDATAEPVFRAVLLGDEEELAAEAIDLLADLDGPVAGELLRRGTSSPSGFVARYSELALAGRGELGPATLERASEDSDFELRLLAVRHAAAAWRSSGRRGARPLEQVVLGGLVDPSSAVRAEAARRCGELGLASAVSALRALLADEGERVRVEAAGALLALRQPQVP
jgi:hypothetical protein